jgi:hypothetical protein
MTVNQCNYHSIVEILVRATMAEDNTYVLKGPSSSKTVTNTSVGKLIYDQLLTHCCEHEAMVRY